MYSFLCFFSQVETCRETLMTLSLTDAENANTDPVVETVNSVTPETSIETKGETEETDGTVNDDDDEDAVVSADSGSDGQGVIQVNTSSDCDGDSVENLTVDDPPPGGDVTAMSTDESEHEVGTSLPQTPTSPDENANSKC